MNRRLLFGISLVLLFSIVVLVWYFIFATPPNAPSLETPNNPFPSTATTKGFQFINNRKDLPSSASTTEVTPASLHPLTEIWDKPATGASFVSREILKEVDIPAKTGTSTERKIIRATSTLLMFVDRTTGYVYGYNLDDGTVYQISNSTIPGVYDAYIFDNGNRIILRYIDSDKHSIVSLLATIPQTIPSSPAEPLKDTKYLPTGVTSISMNKKGDKLSYIVKNNSGSSIYTLSTKGATLLTTSPFKEWSLSYGGENLFATSKPSAYIEGLTASIPSFNYILGGKTGLMSNPSEKGTLLNSMWSSQGLVSFLSSSSGQLVLPLSTLSSKCVWGQKEYLLCAIPGSLPKSTEGLPDDWFQGKFFFSDSLFIINTSSGNPTLLYSFDGAAGDFDVTHPSLSLDNLLLSFIRKQDNSLWLLRSDLIQH